MANPTARPDAAGLLARIDALERDRRRAFDDAQREADALFAPMPGPAGGNRNAAPLVPFRSAGPAFTLPPVGVCHATLPLRSSSANTSPLSAPKYTRPP